MQLESLRYRRNRRQEGTEGKREPTPPGAFDHYDFDTDRIKATGLTLIHLTSSL